MHPRRALPAMLLLTAVLGALLVGCGGNAEEKNAYVEQVQAAQRSFAEAFDGIRAGLTATSTRTQDRATLTAFGDGAKAFADRLRKVTPPAEVRAEHGRLIEVVAAYERQIRRAVADLRGASATRRAEVRTSLSSGVQATQARIAAAINAINSALQS